MKTPKIFQTSFLLTVMITMLLAGQAVAAKLPVTIFYLPHPPAMRVLNKVNNILDQHGKGLEVVRFDMESKQGKKAMAKYGINEHLPIMIFIDGRSDFQVNGAAVKLKNFPKGDSFVPIFSGDWDYPDLEAILQEKTES